jgi:hypothetical protein
VMRKIGSNARAAFAMTIPSLNSHIVWSQAVRLSAPQALGGLFSGAGNRDNRGYLMFHWLTKIPFTAKFLLPYSLLLSPSFRFLLLLPSLV